MLTPEAFDEFIREIAELNGLSLEEAGDLAVAIGDTPEMDEEGLAVVRGEDGAVLRRVRILAT